MGKCGIYCIISKIDNKKYIGQSISISERISYHFRELKHNRHTNRHLQSSFNLHGRTNFYYTILELCDSNKLTELENEYMRKYNTLDKHYGYNFQYEINGKHKHSIETIELLKTIRTGIKVYSFKPDGTFLKEYTSISSCAKELNVNPCDIRRTINQKQRTCKGLVLNNKKEFRLRENLRKYNIKNLSK